MGLAGGLALAGKGVADLISPSTRAYAGTKLSGLRPARFSTTEKVTPSQVVTTYNNYYEFGTEKDQPAKNAQKFVTSPWTRFRGRRSGQAAQVLDGRNPEARAAGRADLPASLRGGVVHRRALDRLFVQHASSKLVEPTPKAQFVAFESYFDTKQMPLWGRAGIQLPYVEGLRLDEAMHPLALLTVGMYGETLPNQDGAPVRMVIPWKYGFKSIKSLVKIKFVKDQPPTTWNITNAHEYGFYSNVNPKVDHPRWSQAREVRLPGYFKNTKTLMFNGYGDQVASLYTGMDLKKNF